jgi:KipI family sensor histidine kinase inhibitor
MAASADIAGKLNTHTSIAVLNNRTMPNSGKRLNPKLKPGQRQSRPAEPPPGAAWRWVSERGVHLATGAATLARYRQLISLMFEEIESIIPADDSLLVVLHPGAAPSAALQSAWSAALADEPATAGRLHELSVAYGGKHGPDLPALAAAAGLSEAAFVAAHAAAEYRVAFLGFQPGFAYLRGLPPALFAPRHTTPRVRVPAGSLAIGGAYTGIYPATGPGGWQVIGLADTSGCLASSQMADAANSLASSKMADASSLFDPEREPPALFAPGDRVRFIPR